MVYDAARQRIVVFGGQAGPFPNGVQQSDTWEWDGTGWSQRATSGPPARFHQNLAYDRARQRVILYGGFILPNTELRDIWEWDGTTWRNATVATPAGEISLGSFFDEKSNAFYVFASKDNAATTIMDRWNGTTLTRLTTPGPSCAIPQPQLVSMGATRGAYFYSGDCGGTSATPQLWHWDGAVWTRLNITLPEARINGAAAYDRDRDRMVFFGGENLTGQRTFAETWEFDGTTFVRKS
jgi:hypothetical protein